MKKPELITTEKFGDIICNFYKDANDEILLTREQIGMALEYSSPQKAIDNIHAKHYDRLNELSITLKTRGKTGQEYNTTFYTQRGIMEICRWSRQSKANEFMDWCWNIIENYRNGKSANDISIITALTTLTESIGLMHSSLNDRLTKLEESQQKKNLPDKKYSRWKTNTFKKLVALQSYVNEESDEKVIMPRVIHLLIQEMEDTYDVELNDYEELYKCEFDIDIKAPTLDVINHYKDIRDMFTLTLDSILEKLNIENIKESKSNIFDLLAEKIKIDNQKNINENLEADKNIKEEI